MEKHKLRKPPTINRITLTTMISITFVFTLTIVLLLNYTSSKSVERAKTADIEYANQITFILKDNFDFMSRMLSLTRESLATLDFRSEPAGAGKSADHILSAILDLNPDLYRAWFVFDKGVYYEDRLYIREYTRKEGAIIESFSMNAGEILQNPDSAPWYSAPMTTGDTYFTTAEPHKFSVDDEPVYTATISMPIFANGKIVGVAGVDILYSDIVDLIYGRHNGQSRNFMLLYQDMTVLQALDGGYINKNLADFPFKDINNMRVAMKRGEIYSNEIFSPILNEKAFIYLQPISVDVGSYRQSLYLLIGTPLRELNAEAYSITFFIIIASCVCILFIFGIIFFSAKRFVYSIKDLARQVKQLTSGDIKISTFDISGYDMRSNSEITTLQHAFNEMLHSLQENICTVEKRVEERTKELRKLNKYIELLIESTPDISILTDQDLNILYCSHAYMALTGIKHSSEIVGKNLSTIHQGFTDTDYVDRFKTRISRILSGEDKLIEDDIVNWPNGETRLYRIIYSQVKDDKNIFEGVVLIMRDLTDIRQEEAEHRMNDMLNSTRIACFVWNEDGHIIAYNKEISRIFGLPDDLSPEEFDQLYFSIQPEYQPSGIKSETVRMETLHEALEKGFAQVSGKLSKFDGTPIYVNVIVSRISWMSSYRMVVYHYDTTDLAEKEIEAKAAEERIRLMLDATPLCIYFITKDSICLDCNQEAANLFGLSGKQEFMERYYELSPQYQPSGRLSAEWRKEIIEKALKEDYNSFEWMHQNLTGELIPCEITIVRTQYQKENVLLVYTRDLREYKKAMAEIYEANERTRIMLNSTPMICILRDENNRVIDCNQAAVDIFGAANKVELIRNYHKLYPDYQPDGSRSIDKANELIHLMYEQGALDNYEWMFRTLSGEPLPVEGTFVMIQWEGVTRLLSYYRDLREVKTKEQQMRNSAEREREATLQREAAQAANEAKSQFLTNMSHEIRTPMNAVLGMSELLLHEKLNERQLRYTEDIKTAATALLDIINDILDVSKIQAGKFNLVPVHYDFHLLIDNIGSMAQFLFENKNISFKLTVQEFTPVCLYGDDVRLRQVLLNLLGNAVKFTKEGHVILAVSHTDTMIKITVSDTGIGIPEESFPRLFDAFEQVDVIKNRTTKGTGLGLTITKAIVEMMGGHISVESVYGKGTSFHVEIPKIPGDELLIHNLEDKDIAIYAPDAKILVVDDNKTNLNVACGLLQLCGIPAETAESGGQAIEMIRQKQYDIVFMDHRMPEMSGVDTTKIIRKLGIDVPVIALTASAIDGAKKKMLDAGMNDYLWKPIKKVELIQILQKWIPAHKLLNPPARTGAHHVTEDDGQQEFWEKIKQIEGLSVMTGLERVDGQRGVYKKSLKLLLQEIEKSVKNLPEFLSADDMENFRIEVHGIKGAMANTGAMELSEKAYKLEMAADRADAAFCVENLPAFLESLGRLSFELKEVFEAIKQSDGSIDIPPDLPRIFKKMADAFAEIDLVCIDEEINNLNALNMNGALRDKIEQIKDAVMLMDYDGADKLIRKLLNGM